MRIAEVSSLLVLLVGMCCTSTLGAAPLSGIEGVRVAAAQCFSLANPQTCLTAYVSKEMYFPELNDISRKGGGPCEVEYRAAVARASHGSTVTGPEFLSCIFKAKDLIQLGNNRSALEGLRGCLTKGIVEQQWEAKGYVNGDRTLCYFQLEDGHWKLEHVSSAP